MLAQGFIARVSACTKRWVLPTLLLALAVGCATRYQYAPPHHPVTLGPYLPFSSLQTNYSYASHVMFLPLYFSRNEALDRQWHDSEGRVVSLQRTLTFTNLHDRPDITVAFFGTKDPSRTVCIDFLAGPALSQNFVFVCHDNHPPGRNTTVEMDIQQGRYIFFVKGYNTDEANEQRTWHLYSYELNPEWQMLEGISHFTWH